MNVAEIISKARSKLRDPAVDIDIDDVNDAILFIAGLSWLPDLISSAVVKFDSEVNNVSDASNASPIVITTAAAHGWKTSDYVKPENIGGNTAANDISWYIEKLTTTTFSLLGSQGNGAYTSGGTVTKRNHSKSLATDFHHDLFKAFSITNKRDLNIRTNKKALDRLYEPSQIFYGNLVDVAEEGGVLHGRPVPQTDEIVAYDYYAKPETLTAQDAIPTIIPIDLHEELIVSRILIKKFDTIEKAGPKEGTPNLNKYLNAFKGGMATLNHRFPAPSKKRPKIRRRPQFF